MIDGRIGGSSLEPHQTPNKYCLLFTSCECSFWLANYQPSESGLINWPPSPLSCLFSSLLPELAILCISNVQHLFLNPDEPGKILQWYIRNERLVQKNRSICVIYHLKWKADKPLWKYILIPITLQFGFLYLTVTQRHFSPLAIFWT